jgi:hypothetical protein
MLKFIRKYQLIILAIGGSLLMVVFLLEPVISSFQRTQNNRTVARYADGTTVGSMARDQAEAELQLAQRIAPVVFAPRAQGGLGLTVENTDGVDRVHHWLMLSRLAEEAGVVGGAEDGRSLIEDQSQVIARQYVQQNMMAVFQGIVTQEELLGQADQYMELIRAQARREVQAMTAAIRGSTEDDIWRMLAKFQGAYRLNQLYFTAPAFSPEGARSGIAEMNNAAAMNAALIPGSMLAHTIPDPTEAELRAFFEPRAGAQPSEDEFGIGYAQPARVKVEWLQLKRGEFLASVPTDRVELRKIWQVDSTKPVEERQFPGDFASEREAIESVFRGERADRMLVEADQIIRAKVLGVTRQLDNDDGRLDLPEDWAQTRPSLAGIAESIVTEFAGRNTPIPTPTVEQLEARWLTGSDIGQIPEFGRAFFRTGTRVTFMSQLPDQIDERGLLPIVGLQVGVPQVDPAAQDDAGNRYYLTITDFRAAGPSRSIDDAGRARVVADYKAVQGYLRLVAMQSEIEQAAMSPQGVTAAVDLAAGGVLPDGVQRPGVYPNIRVSRLRIDQGPLARSVDQRLNSQVFRDAAVAALEGIDPLATPDQFESAPVVIGVPMPIARSLAIARLVAPRPFTQEQFRTRFAQTLAELNGMGLRDALQQADAVDPFSYEALSARYGLISVVRDGDDAG